MTSTVFLLQRWAEWAQWQCGLLQEEAQCCSWVSEVTQSCPTLCDPMDCSPPGSSVHGIFQAVVLEWIAISFSRGSSRPRDQTRLSCIVDRHFTVWATREVLLPASKWGSYLLQSQLGPEGLTVLWIWMFSALLMTLFYCLATGFILSSNGLYFQPVRQVLTRK